MKLAYVQFSPAFCDVDETMTRLAPLLDQCGRADLVVVPELCNSGYHFSTRQEAATCAEPVDNSRFLDFLRDQCRTHGFEIVSGFNESDGDVLYNSAVLVTAEGVAGRYRKLHLFMNEQDFFAAGDLGLPVLERPYGRIGMLICFDWAFPEAWRVLALRGADIICHPANLVLPGLAQRAIPVYALTNRVFIVTANRVGTERDLTFTGTSLLADPSGDLVIDAPQSGSAVGMAEVEPELARNKQITARNHLFRDRRPSDYREICAG
jgi:predicted amidohydrolase